MEEADFLELPVIGATGYSATRLDVHCDANRNSKVKVTVTPGSAFLILEEQGEWWKIEVEGMIGYVYNPICMINLPDVVPSIVYRDTNATASVLKSSFLPIPNITGEQLYQAFGYNERLGKDEFMMPVLYGAAKKIAKVQQLALAQGNTLVIYELYRPYAAQQKIVTELTNFSEKNDTVLKWITTEPWELDWFIATTISNHQRGYAMDTSLGKIIKTETKQVGTYEYTSVVEYEEYEMSTPIHELSSRSASLVGPVPSSNDHDWRTMPMADTMNEWTILLREYCTSAGLTPLSSEWWHFNDLESMKKAEGVGDYYIEGNLSVAPEKV